MAHECQIRYPVTRLHMQRKKDIPPDHYISGSGTERASGGDYENYKNMGLWNPMPSTYDALKEGSQIATP